MTLITPEAGAHAAVAMLMDPEQVAALPELRVLPGVRIEIFPRDTSAQIQEAADIYARRSVEAGASNPVEWASVALHAMADKEWPKTVVGVTTLNIAQENQLFRELSARVRAKRN